MAKGISSESAAIRDSVFSYTLQDACVWASFFTPSLAILCTSQPEGGGILEGLNSVPSWKLPFYRLPGSPAHLIAAKLIPSSHLASNNSGRCLYTGPLMPINKIRNKSWIVVGNSNLCIGYCQSNLTSRSACLVEHSVRQETFSIFDTCDYRACEM